MELSQEGLCHRRVKKVKKDWISIIAVAIGIIGGGSAIISNIKSSDNQQVSIVSDVDNLKRSDAAKSQAIERLQHDVATIKHQQLETSLDVKHVIKLLDGFVKVTVKRD